MMDCDSTSRRRRRRLSAGGRAYNYTVHSAQRERKKKKKKESLLPYVVDYLVVTTATATCIIATFTLIARCCCRWAVDRLLGRGGCSSRRGLVPVPSSTSSFSPGWCLLLTTVKVLSTHHPFHSAKGKKKERNKNRGSLFQVTRKTRQKMIITRWNLEDVIRPFNGPSSEVLSTPFTQRCCNPPSVRPSVRSCVVSYRGVSTQAEEEVRIPFKIIMKRREEERIYTTNRPIPAEKKGKKIHFQQ